VKLLADENIDRPIVERLRKDGHLVLHVAEMQPGIPDEQVMQKANQEKALLLTADRDFGELVFRQDRAMYGVILIRLAGLSPHRKVKIVSAALQKHGEALANSFTVIDRSSIRIRKRFL
jgi:predicted nuclease of predicted toxin-antitoxin system